MPKFRKIKSSKAEIEKFLVDIKRILNAPNFDVKRDFIFQELRLGDDENDLDNNSNTMLALNYSAEDIVEEIKELRVEHYSETIIDCKTDGLVPLYVFGKVIQNREVYIKMRIKVRKNGAEFVFCLSFHFAKHPMEPFPYA